MEFGHLSLENSTKTQQAVKLDYPFGPHAAGEEIAYSRFTGGVIGGVAILGSIFAHEAAHAVVASRHGVEVSSITLWLLGGVAHLEDEAPSPRAEAQIAGAGPLVSLALAIGLAATGASLRIVDLAPLLAGTLLWLAFMNGILAVFNLLPGAPLDGGRLVHAWVWRRTGDKAQASRRATGVGKVIGLGLAAFGVVEVVVFGNIGGLWTSMIGWFLYAAAGQEAQFGTVAAGLSGRTLRDVMSPLPEPIADWSSVADLLADPPVGTSRLLAVDFGGDPSAVVELDQLAKLVGAARKPEHGTLRIRDLPLTEPIEVEGDRPAADAIRKSPGKPIIVTEEGRAIGIVTAREIERAIALRKLAPTEDDPLARAA